MTHAHHLQALLKSLGPGLLWAGAAIGVSHLVQSTSAGADFYFSLFWVIIIANFFKYPFFEFGPRYAAATGTSLLDGYHKIGRFAVIIFSLLTLATMFTIQATVTSVTAALTAETFAIKLGTVQWSGILLGSCLLLLAIGHFSALDKAMKLIVITLTVLTLFAVISAFYSTDFSTPRPAVHFDWFNKTHIFFLIALMGWMPCPLEISVWHSIWTVARTQQTGHKPSLKHALFDYKVGYYGTAFLALCFLSLGALLMYGKISNYALDGASFAKNLIAVYTQSLGPWAKYIITIAAFTTMFSTMLTTLDGSPRVLQRSIQLLFNKNSKPNQRTESKYYWFWIILLTIGTLVLISFYANSMQPLVKLATIFSFLVAPVIAFLNYKLVTSRFMPQDMQPGKWLRFLSGLGMLYLIGFSLWFIYLSYFTP
jgi:Mn2+/Fe2+ NRAMP family transporter